MLCYKLSCELIFETFWAKNKYGPDDTHIWVWEWPWCNEGPYTYRPCYAAGTISGRTVVFREKLFDSFRGPIGDCGLRHRKLIGGPSDILCETPKNLGDDLFCSSLFETGAPSMRRRYELEQKAPLRTQPDTNRYVGPETPPNVFSQLII